MTNPAPAHDFKATAAAALAQAETVLAHWLPDGKRNGHEYQALNPTRADSRPGSFSINTNTGQWADFAMDDSGGDLVSLVAYLDDCAQGEAETRLAEFLGLQRNKRVTRVTSVTGLKNKEKPVTQPDSVTRDTRDIPTEKPNFTHPKHGKPAAVWTYHTADGQPWFYVVRFDTPDGKQILPRSWDGTGWRWKGVDAPRPLYNLHKFLQLPDWPVLVTEGEKAADAAAHMSRWIATTSPNGSKAPDKADFSPLKGRTVYIWPDNDDAGADYAERVAELAHEAGAVAVSILRLDKLPGAPLPEKWDAADANEIAKNDIAFGLHFIGALTTTAEWWQEIPKPTEPPALPERYSLDDAGLYYTAVDKEGNDLPPEWVASRLEVTAMTRDADNGAWGRLLEFTDRDGHPHRWPMPLELLAGDGNEYRRALLSMGLEISPAPKARHRLTEYIQTAPIQARARCVSKTGWHSGVFVLPDDTLVYPAANNVTYALTRR